jgi:hypothetical protein
MAGHTEAKLTLTAARRAHANATQPPGLDSARSKGREHKVNHPTAQGRSIQ